MLAASVTVAVLVAVILQANRMTPKAVKVKDEP